MKHKYTALQLNAFMTVVSTAKCACPARVCGTIIELRELYDYQSNCMIGEVGDRKTHTAIAVATEQAHAVMEACLTEILEIEGIDPHMLPIPSVS